MIYDRLLFLTFPFMKAYVVSKPGGPETLELKTIPDPVPQLGEALIHIHAFGLNRAEAITRAGGSFGAVTFPKVIGIECVGEVIDCPGGELPLGQKVAAAMGGMGRKYNGSYAEKVVVPISNVFPVDTNLDWVTFGSIPETYFTAWGCCFESLKITQNPKIVMKPGASALGIAITQIVNHLGGEVIGVTRSEQKVDKLMEAGMYKVLVSRDSIADQVLEVWPTKAMGIIDTIASQDSVKDDLDMLAPGGELCLAGSLAESYKNSPHVDQQTIFSKDNISYYSSEELHSDKDTSVLQAVVNNVERGVYNTCIDAVFSFGDVVKAHELMEQNAFAGKVVIDLNR